jgi:hypothetical protein
VPLVEQGLLTLPEHLCSLPDFSGVRVTRSLVLCVYSVDTGPGSSYDKWNISVVICDTDMPYRSTNAYTF